jgi:hypothetical protein
MKRIILLTAVSMILIVSAQAQSKVSKKDLRGEWKMVFDFDEEDLEEGIDDNFWLGSIISGPMSGFVMDILDEIDIQMEFLDGGKLKITVDAFGEEEVEYDKWYLTSKGELVIGDDDEDEVWMLEGKKLYQYDKLSRGRLEKQEVFLVRR